MSNADKGVRALSGNFFAAAQDFPNNFQMGRKKSCLFGGNMLYSTILIALMALVAVAAIILVLLQPANSQGIDALGGSSETFYGKNKGRSIESKLKLWTIICVAVLAVLSVIFFILQIPGIWA